MDRLAAFSVKTELVFKLPGCSHGEDGSSLCLD